MGRLLEPGDTGRDGVDGSEVRLRAGHPEVVYTIATTLHTLHYKEEPKTNAVNLTYDMRFPSRLVIDTLQNTLLNSHTCQLIGDKSGSHMSTDHVMGPPRF